jgi:hypothetical protein
MRKKYSMIWNSHSQLAGQHAFLSASKYHWINYDGSKLAEAFTNSQAAKRGTELHALAHELIRLGVKLPKTNKTLNAFVNDAIGFRMRPEQTLFYSPNCYGTPDAICYGKSLLRIHDLKTGAIPGSMHQLEIYAALYCLEYACKPGEIEIELRLYQSDQIHISQNPVDEVAHIMSKIVVFDDLIEQMKARGVA